MKCFAGAHSAPLLVQKPSQLGMQLEIFVQAIGLSAPLTRPVPLDLQVSLNSFQHF